MKKSRLLITVRGKIHIARNSASRASRPYYPFAGLTWRLPRHNTPLPIMSIYHSFCQHGLGASSKNVVLDYLTTDKKAIEMLVYLQQNCSDEVFAGYASLLISDFTREIAKTPGFASPAFSTERIVIFD